MFLHQGFDKNIFVNEQAMSGGEKKGFWVLISFNKFHLILNVSINSTEGVEEFGAFVLFICVCVCVCVFKFHFTLI